MKKIILIAMMAILTGCANKATISCPSCTISNNTYTCTECKVEVEVSEDFELISIPSLPTRP